MYRGFKLQTGGVGGGDCSLTINIVTHTERVFVLFFFFLGGGSFSPEFWLLYQRI